MDIGIAFDLKADRQDDPRAHGDGPDDLLEEYDSPATVEAIERALAARGHRVHSLGGGRRFLARVLSTRCDLVFNIAEGAGTRSREAHVPSVLEMLRIPYTHSDPLTLALSLDKAMAKRVVASHGIATPRFRVVESPGDLRGLDLAFPLMCKPLAEGSSMGIRRRSRARDARELEAQVSGLLAGYREPVLVEEFCPGAEFTVGILGTGPGARAIAVMEVVPRRVPVEEFVYSLEVKRNPAWTEEVELCVPPRRPRRLLEELERLALEAYRALGCRDVGRVDLRLSAGGEPRFLEANPLPGLAPGWSDLALLCERSGFSYDGLIGAILDEACLRLGLGRSAARGAAVPC